jgi:hypothetical protein
MSVSASKKRYVQVTPAMRERRRARHASGLALPKARFGQERRRFGHCARASNPDSHGNVVHIAVHIAARIAALSSTFKGVMFMTALSMSLAACVATTAGGLLAFAWRDRLQGLLAFGVGTLLGVAVMHLLPESAALARELGWGLPLTVVAALAGLGSLHAIEK